MQGVDPALEGEKGRRPVLTLLREEKVAAEPTDELHFLSRRLVLWFLKEMQFPLFSYFLRNEVFVA